MKKPHSLPSMKSLAILACTALLATAATPRAALLLSDSFTGTAGTLLNGRAVQYYNPSYYTTGPVWNASTRVLLSGNNTATVDSANANGGAVVAIPQAINSGVVSVEGSIVAQGATYVALSLLSNGNTNVFDSANPFLLTLRDNGAVTLYKNGGSSTLYSAGISGFSATTAYAVSLQYSFELSLASIYINSTLFASVPVTGLNSSSITGAGFYFLSGEPTSSLDNFQVNVTPVPEPSTVMLAGLALVFGIGSYRRITKGKNSILPTR